MGRSKARQDEDGLNSVNYNIMLKEYNHLYTHILADISMMENLDQKYLDRFTPTPVPPTPISSNETTEQGPNSESSAASHLVNVASPIGNMTSNLGNKTSALGKSNSILSNRTSASG